MFQIYNQSGNTVPLGEVSILPYSFIHVEEVVKTPQLDFFVSQRVLVVTELTKKKSEMVAPAEAFGTKELPETAPAEVGENEEPIEEETVPADIDTKKKPRGGK